MSTRLRAGPVISASGTAIIPVARVVTAVEEPMVWGALIPVAVVVLSSGEPVTWAIDGRVEPTERWLRLVPELEGLLAAAMAVE